MNVLVADDDLVSRQLMSGLLKRLPVAVNLARDGTEAWALLKEVAFDVAVVDWMMPGLDGLALCLHLQTLPRDRRPYAMLVTVRDRTEDIVAGLSLGANDYITKPFNGEEFLARVQVGLRYIHVHRSIAEQVGQLEQALHRVHHLPGLLPVCSSCKRVRDDQEQWLSVEDYLASRASSVFTHGLCPECLGKFRTGLE